MMKNVLKEWFIEAPWGKIALISWGCAKGGKVLLVHGRQDSAATFEPLLELLPDDLHYVALDLPGHGLSDPFPIGIALSRIHFVTPIDLVVRHLKWKSFTYMSHSMGGEIGLFYNAARPNLIKQFIHLDIGIALHSISQKPWSYFFQTYDDYYSNYDKVNIDDRIYTHERAVESVRGARGVSDQLAALLLRRNLRAVPAAPAHPAALAAPDAPADHEEPTHYKLSWDKRLKSLASLNLPYEHMVYLFTTNVPPSLFIAATDSVKVYLNNNTERLIREMEQRVPGFEYREVEGSHDVHLTHPERVAELVCGALAQVAAVAPAHPVRARKAKL